MDGLKILAIGEGELEDLLTEPSGEIAFTIIRAIVENRNEYVHAVNTPNNGWIENRSRDAVVEVSCKRLQDSRTRNGGVNLNAKASDQK